MCRYIALEGVCDKLERRRWLDARHTGSAQAEAGAAAATTTVLRVALLTRSGAARGAGVQAGRRADRRAGWGFVDVRLEAAQRERPAR